LLAEASQAGAVRMAVPNYELPTSSLHALESAGSMSSRTAVGRLVQLVIAALRSR
jgi:hypothetical protein